MAPPRTRKITPPAAPETVLEGEIVDMTVPATAPPVDAFRWVEVGLLRFQMQQPSDDQLAVLAKVARAAERDQSNGVRLIEVFFRVIETCLADEADGERIEDALIDKTLTILQLTEAIGTDKSDAKQAKTTARTRRGR